MSEPDIDRVTLNLSGAEAKRLIVVVDHLRQTSTGEAAEHHESIYTKLERSIGGGADEAGDRDE